MTVERVQTGVRMERSLLKVLKGLAEYLDLSLGDLLEGIVLHAFEGEQAFRAPTLDVIAELKRIYGCELTAADSHRMREAGEPARAGEAAGPGEPAGPALRPGGDRRYRRRAASAALAAGQSSSVIAYWTVSRQLPSNRSRCLRRTPSRTAPSRSIAACDRVLKMSVCQTTRTAPEGLERERQHHQLRLGVVPGAPPALA